MASTPPTLDRRTFLRLGILTTGATLGCARGPELRVAVLPERPERRERGLLAGACGLLWIGCLWACAGGPPSGEPAPPDVAALIPPIASLPGWTIAEATTIYDPGNLYLYHDGGAPRYLDLGFARLAHARFAMEHEGSRSVTLDVYDMGSRLGAFAIYAAGRPREIAPRAWGSEGYLLGEVAAAWKGRIYVHVLADDRSPPLVAMGERLAERVIASVPGDASPPEILSRLPAEGLAPNTTEYVAKDLFGHAFLPGGLLARYECEPEECLVFICDLTSSEAAAQALERWRAHESARGALLEGVPGIGAGGFRAKEPGLGVGLVIRDGPTLAGVWGGGSEQRRESLLRTLAARRGGGGRGSS